VATAWSLRSRRKIVADIGGECGPAMRSLDEFAGLKDFQGILCLPGKSPKEAKRAKRVLSLVFVRGSNYP